MRQWIFYNQLLNIGWCLIGFFPVCWYWFTFYSFPPLLMVTVIGSLALLVPYRFYGQFQLSRSRSFYERLGVRSAQWVSQNGGLIRWLIKRTDPNFRYVGKKEDLKKIRSQMVINEKFHAFCFIFFLGSCFLALQKQVYTMAVGIFMVNIVINVYPILIQQYNRTRSGALMKMMGISTRLPRRTSV